MTDTTFNITVDDESPDGLGIDIEVVREDLPKGNGWYVIGVRLHPEDARQLWGRLGDALKEMDERPDA